MPNKVRYIIWEYDQFPYVLCGKAVGRADSEGRVAVEGYDGMRFLPLRIVTGSDGEVLCGNLQWLKRNYREQQDDLKRHFCNLALGLAPFLKHCKHTSAYSGKAAKGSVRCKRGVVSDG